MTLEDFVSPRNESAKLAESEAVPKSLGRRGSSSGAAKRAIARVSTKLAVTKACRAAVREPSGWQMEECFALYSADDMTAISDALGAPFSAKRGKPADLDDATLDADDLAPLTATPRSGRKFVSASPRLCPVLFDPGPPEAIDQEAASPASRPWASEQTQRVTSVDAESCFDWWGQVHAQKQMVCGRSGAWLRQATPSRSASRCSAATPRSATPQTSWQTPLSRATGGQLGGSCLFTPEPMQCPAPPVMLLSSGAAAASPFATSLRLNGQEAFEAPLYKPERPAFFPHTAFARTRTARM